MMIELNGDNFRPLNAQWPWPTDNVIDSCERCAEGEVFKIADDVDGRGNAVYVPALGCSFNDGEWLCEGCTTMDAAFAAEYGCTISPYTPKEATWTVVSCGVLEADGTSTWVERVLAA